MARLGSQTPTLARRRRTRNRSAEALEVGLPRARKGLLTLAAQADAAGKTESFRQIQTAIVAIEDAETAAGLR